jgi:Protein-L-isoaspartate(D-aspartate) O-methyltransferase (PCMT)
VTAIEYDAELAARATANVAQTPHVGVVHGDGTRIAFEPADVIYVNAGATRPADAWLDRLKEGGRLILPLTRMHFRTAMCGGEPCSGSSGTARNFWRAGSLGSRSFPVRAAVMRPVSGRRAPLSRRAAPSA